MQVSVPKPSQGTALVIPEPLFAECDLNFGMQGFRVGIADLMPDAFDQPLKPFELDVFSEFLQIAVR